MVRKTKMQKRNKDSKDDYDELKDDSETTAPSNATVTEKLNQNHGTKPSAQAEVTVTEKSNQNNETKPSAQSEVTATEKLSQDHETKPSVQSEVTVTEKLNQNNETKPSAQSEVTATEKLSQDHETKPSVQSEVSPKENFNQNHETKPSAQAEVTVTEKLNQNNETKPSAQSEVTATEKLSQDHETKPSVQSEVSPKEKFNQNHETKPSAQAEVTVTEKLNQNNETKPSAQSEVTATEKLNQDHETKPSVQSEVSPKQKFNHNHETKPSAQSEVTATEKLNQDHETKTNAQSEVTSTEKFIQDHGTKPIVQSEVTPKEKFNQNHETKPSAQSEVTATEKLKQDHETKTNAQPEVSYTDWQTDEKINNIRKQLRELQARRAQLQQANNDMSMNSADFLLVYILLSQEKENVIKKLYDALEKANRDIKDREADIKKINEENKYLTGKLEDAEANLVYITDLKVNLEKEIIDLTVQNKSLRNKVDNVELLSRILEYVAGNTNESLLSPGNILLEENTHPLITQIVTILFLLRNKIECLEYENKDLKDKLLNLKENDPFPEIDNSVMSINTSIQNQELIYETFTANDQSFSNAVEEVRQIRNYTYLLPNKTEQYDLVIKELKLLFERKNEHNRTVNEINSTIQNQESINEMFTTNDESFNNAVEEVRQELENKTKEHDLLIKEILSFKQNEQNETVKSLIVNMNDLNNEKQHLETKITSILNKNTTIHPKDIDELTEKYTGLTLNSNENVEQLRGDVPSTSTESNIKKKSKSEEPTGNGSVKRRIKEASGETAPTGHLRHEGTDPKPKLGYDIEGQRKYYYAKMGNDVLLASSTEEISKTNPIAETPVQNIGTFENPTNTDKNLIQMKIVVSATCGGDIAVETTARVQTMEEELRNAKARENKLREQLNEYKNAALVDKTTKIVRKKRQLQHDQRRPYQP